MLIILHSEHLETTPFEERAFVNEMVSSLDFVKRSQHPVDIFTNPASQELYRDVSLIKLWAMRNGGMSLTDTQLCVLLSEH